MGIALEEASLVLALISRLLPALGKSQAWGRLQPGIFRLAWLYGRLDARVHAQHNICLPLNRNINVEARLLQSSAAAGHLPTGLAVRQARRSGETIRFTLTSPKIIIRLNIEDSVCKPDFELTTSATQERLHRCVIRHIAFWWACRPGEARRSVVRKS